MIIDFSFGNYKSFKDIQTLNMTAANITSKYKSLDDNNVFSFNDINLLKSKAIYGPNASGKSNVIAALVTFISIVNRSFKDDEVLIGIENFRLSNGSAVVPTFFQIKFILNNKIYRYGFEADDSKIHSEWLFESKNLKNEKKLFVRDGDILEINDKSFKEGKKLILLTTEESKEQSNNKVLILSLGKAINGNICKAIVNYISSITVVSGLGLREMQRQATLSLKDVELKKKITQMLQIADVGINDVDLLEITEENLPDDAPADVIEFLRDGKKISEVLTLHPLFNTNDEQIGDVPFSLSRDESQGTKKMFELSVFIIRSIEEGRPLFIDEFDARFHPELTRKLIELFNSPTNNSTQFVVVTHDTTLLSSNLLRRDQICFVEKSKFGVSKLYSLSDFKGVRNDASLEKDYNHGKFGAVPYIGNFESVIF